VIFSGNIKNLEANIAVIEQKRTLLKEPMIISSFREPLVQKIE
jgi:hypothetical protein